MTNSDKTFTLIQNLHALATGKGATEAEAQTALEKMQKLLFKHNLDIAEVLAARPDSKSCEPEFVQDHASVLRGRYGPTLDRGLPQAEREWRTKLAFSIARYNFCRLLKDKLFSAVYFYGTKENIEAVKAIWTYVVDQVHDLSYSELRVCKQAGFRVNGRTWRQEFLDGICARVESRLYEQFKVLRDETTQSTALVVFNDKALATFVDQFSSKRRSAGYSQHGRGIGYTMGVAAGDKVRFTAQPKELN